VATARMCQPSAKACLSSRSPTPAGLSLTSAQARRAACLGAAIGIAGVAVHSLVDFGLHAIVNALVFTTLIVIATSKPQWGNEPPKLYD